MAILKTISGIRGTIGGKEDEGLSPIDVVKYTASFGQLMITPSNKKIVVGRDGRMSGAMVHQLVTATLQSIGATIIDLGLSTTPTVEMAVKIEGAAGGIILTASHNPREWNALKLLNSNGEFINAEIGQEVLANADNKSTVFAEVTELGTVVTNNTYMQKHIDAILAHPLVNVKAIAAKNFSVVVDAINSTGATFVPALLNALGVYNITVINNAVTGNFAHNPEPLPENLKELCSTVVDTKSHIGIAVDPDVDRLCFVNEDGSLFGEEYTLVAVADYILQHKKGNTVSNLSSTRALRDVTEKHGGTYYASAVGEVNVVSKMKEMHAVIGGEGNGGIIVPELHYGRDALIGIALFLSHLATFGKSMSQLRSTYPQYVISKNKIELDASIDLQKIFTSLKEKYKAQPINDIDGLKIEFGNDWVHLRPSNTEPIIRIYSESSNNTTAENIARKIMIDIHEASKA
ncbi:MAG: phosphoglucosamine mutase [Chitinophagaceae bacterium]|jgi:phosphomannomutase|nr:phosphoglucosamine mutase [Chitinophagaceae bacterium]